MAAIAVASLCAVGLASVSLLWFRKSRWDPPVGYDEQRAQTYATLAGAAYCLSDSLWDWSCGIKCIDGVTGVHVCEGATTRSFVGRMDDHGIVSFEGTHTISSMVQDLETIPRGTTLPGCHGCLVHSGFLKEWASMRRCVMAALNDSGTPPGNAVGVTGHSLGGGVSVIAAMDLWAQGWSIREIYTFGMPRAGNSVFAGHFDGLFQDRFFRVTHHMDPVVHVPPSSFNYQHLKNEVFYDGHVEDGFKKCFEGESGACSGKYWDVARDIAFHINDHSDYMDVNTGSAGCFPMPWADVETRPVGSNFSLPTNSSQDLLSAGSRIGPVPQAHSEAQVEPSIDSSSLAV